MKLKYIWDSLKPGDHFLLKENVQSASDEIISHIKDNTHSFATSNCGSGPFIPVPISMEDEIVDYINDEVVANQYYFEIHRGPSLTRNCTCDFYEQVLKYGCICGGQ